MKKWKCGLIISVVVFILGIIVESIFVSSDLIWNIGKYMIFISIVTFIISLIVGIYLSIKESKKIPIWVDIIIAIVITFIVIFVFSKINDNKLKKAYDEQYENNFKNTITYDNDINTNSNKSKTLDPSNFHP